MIYAYVTLLIILAFVGIILNKYFQKQMAQITFELKSIVTNRTGKQIIQNFSTNIYEIKILEDGKEYASDYFSASDNTFYLSKETANSNNGAAVGVAIYLTLLVRIAKQRVRKSSLLFWANSFPQFLIVLFAIIALFTSSKIFFILSIASYSFVLLVDLILNGSQYLISKKSLMKLPTEQDFHFEQNEIHSANRYIGHRQMQALSMFLFTPVLTPAYYLYLVFGGKRK
jgi:hypothetical protein